MKLMLPNQANDLAQQREEIARWNRERFEGKLTVLQAGELAGKPQTPSARFELQPKTSGDLFKPDQLVNKLTVSTAEQ